MSINIKLNVTDGVTPALKSRVAQLEPHRLATRLAVPLSQHWRRHLAGLPKNKMGWPSTGFWEDAARRVKGYADGPNVVLTSDKVGLRFRYYGGTITAKNVNNLTIPICKEAYGTKVSDWGFENLTLIVTKNHTMFFALNLDTKEAKKAYAPLRRLTKHAEGTVARANAFRESMGRQKKKKPVHVAKAKNDHALKFLFVLKKSVTQEGNPNVIPPDLQNVAVRAVKDYLDETVTVTQ